MSFDISKRDISKLSHHTDKQWLWTVRGPVMRQANQDLYARLHCIVVLSRNSTLQISEPFFGLPANMLHSTNATYIFSNSRTREAYCKSPTQIAMVWPNSQKQSIYLMSLWINFVITKALNNCNGITNETPAVKMVKFHCTYVQTTGCVTWTRSEIQEQPQRQTDSDPGLAAPPSAFNILTFQSLRKKKKSHDANLRSYLVWGRGSAESTQALLCGVTAHGTEVTFIGNTPSRLTKHILKTKARTYKSMAC